MHHIAPSTHDSQLFSLFWQSVDLFFVRLPASSSSMSASVQMSTRGGSQSSVTCWNNNAARSLGCCNKRGTSPTQDQLRNSNFQNEFSGSRLIAGLLSDLLHRQPFQLPFLILLDEDRVGTVPSSRKLHDMECAKIHAFSHSVLCVGKGAVNDASNKSNEGWTEHFANKPVMDSQFQR